MKGIKLQIGDYVFIKSPSGDTTLIKIAHTSEKVGYHSTPNKLSWVRIELLEPIPLTSEILEKNEFNKVPQPNCSNPYRWGGGLKSMKKKRMNCCASSRHIVICFVVCIFLLIITVIVSPIISVSN